MIFNGEGEFVETNAPPATPADAERFIGLFNTTGPGVAIKIGLVEHEESHEWFVFTEIAGEQFAFRPDLATTIVNSGRAALDRLNAGAAKAWMGKVLDAMRECVDVIASKPGRGAPGRALH